MSGSEPNSFVVVIMIFAAMEPRPEPDGMTYYRSAIAEVDLAVFGAALQRTGRRVAILYEALVFPDGCRKARWHRRKKQPSRQAQNLSSDKVSPVISSHCTSGITNCLCNPCFYNIGSSVRAYNNGAPTG